MEDIGCFVSRVLLRGEQLPVSLYINTAEPSCVLPIKKKFTCRKKPNDQALENLF